MPARLHGAAGAEQAEGSGALPSSAQAAGTRTTPRLSHAGGTVGLAPPCFARVWAETTALVCSCFFSGPEQQGRAEQSRLASPQGVF